MIEYINLTSLPVFLLIFMRVLGFFVTMPLFSYRNIPAQFKIGFSFFIALMMFQTVDSLSFVLDHTYFLLVAKEVLVGILIGLVAFIILSTLQVMGGFVDFQMGFAIANVVDPQTGAQSPLTGQYFYMIALLFLLAVNGHHLIIDGIYHSYEFIPIDRLIPLGSGTVADFIIQTFNQMFVTAFQMAVPLVGTLFLIDVALGMVARTVPQMNVFVVGLPVKIFVSFFAILIFFPLFMVAVENLFEAMLRVMRQLMELYGGV